MANKKQKLELTWIGKENRPRLEPRILLEDQDNSYHAKHRVTDNDLFDNMLIHGDNLLALKALEQEYRGKVKCVFIDPPYNTGSAFEHYDDGIEHSLWLSLIRERLLIIRELLKEEGSIWISIDDNESHYLKVLCDEIFGRRQFVANVVWQKRTSPDNRLRLGDAHDTILVYYKDWNIGRASFNQLPISEERAKSFKNPDDDPRGPWASTDFTGMTGHATPNQYYTIVSPTGAEHPPPEGRCWALAQETFQKLVDDNRVWFGTKGDSRPRLKRFLNEMGGQNSWTWWTNKEVGHNQEAKKEIIALFGAKNGFDTPKPERLVDRIIRIATNPGDLVLDSFLGSGTTAAVAHKMGRQWIGIELGDHCETHCLPRLKKVVDGEDHGGITEAVNWQGGGGFRYYKLAPTLITTDKWGNEVINPDFNPAMLAEAVCKIEGFKYAPDPDLFWKQGFSTERDFIYVTTQHLNRQQLSFLSEEVGEQTTLLVCCGSFTRGSDTAFENLTVKKLPKAVLKRCEWGHDDYSLKVENLPKAPEPAGQTEMQFD